MFTAVVAQLHVRFAVTQDKQPSSQEFLTFIELCNMIFKVDLRIFWIRFDNPTRVFCNGQKVSGTVYIENDEAIDTDGLLTFNTGSFIERYNVLGKTIVVWNYFELQISGTCQWKLPQLCSLYQITIALYSNLISGQTKFDGFYAKLHS